jgi:hypothetical protein
MLIHREALEVVRLCEKPGDQIAPVATYVFVDDDGRVMATDGHMVLRATGLVKEEPDLFMKDVRGADELSHHALPEELVIDFLKAWRGEQVILREGPCDDGKGPSILETLDGRTSRRFDSKLAGAVDSPNFNSVIKQPKNPRTVVVSVEFLLTITRCLKAMGVKSLKCSIGSEANAPVFLEGKAFVGKNLQELEIDGALMPMRDTDAEDAKKKVAEQTAE